MGTERSESLFELAKRLMVGGVNSPVRAFRSVGGHPIYMSSGKGARMTDVDGNSYLDYVCSWGALILGHSHRQVVTSLLAAVSRGTSFGTCTEAEIELARYVISRIPSVEKIRFVNSGTEATMTALRLARGVTNREKIIKFGGCYHGHGDAFLIKAGSGALTFGMPDSPGVTKGNAMDTLVANFNDLDSVNTLFKQNPEQIAAVIVEPVCGNMGVVQPFDEFLQGLRQLCDENDSLLIFDEVMTGFRVASGGAQELYNVRPDITCLGKIVGGGLPVGAVGGATRILDQLSPMGSIYQAGTLSGNPLAMAAGHATLQNLKPSVYEHLKEKSSMLAKGIRLAAEKHDIQVQVNQVGSMLSIFFTDRPVIDLDTVTKSNPVLYAKFFNMMLKQGIYLPPSAFESWFVCAAIDDEDVDFTISAVDKAFSRLE